jgi:ABC-2 type transport system ATP-binding protein
MQTYAIETDSLKKRYGDLLAVDGLDLAVESGEVFGFLGPNGAGKSTTIDVLLDFVRPTSGSATVLGRDPQAAPRTVRERVGVLPEASGYYGRNTAREHVEFAVEMKRADHDPGRLLERVGIAGDADRPVGSFSKGMRGRLGLAVALVGEPDLLILDEPLGGLDPSGARLLRNVVRAERDRGATVFFSSHIMDQVETLCDRVGIMHDGELLAVDTVAGLRKRVGTPGSVVLAVDTVPEGLRIGDIDGVIGVDRRDGGTRITCKDAGAAGSAVARLDAAGATLRGIDAEGASLERLFLALTDGTSESASTTVEPRVVIDT